MSKKIISLDCNYKNLTNKFKFLQEPLIIQKPKIQSHSISKMTNQSLNRLIQITHNQQNKNFKDLKVNQKNMKNTLRFYKASKEIIWKDAFKPNNKYADSNRKFNLIKNKIINSSHSWKKSKMFRTNVDYFLKKHGQIGEKFWDLRFIKFQTVCH